MFRKIIDSVYDVMVGFREHPLLLCLFIFQIFSGVVYAVSCATETKTVVDAKPPHARDFSRELGG